jgi:hypothetical protein
MAHYDPPFEIHVHGEISLHPEVRFQDVQEALKPCGNTPEPNH